MKRPKNTSEKDKYFIEPPGLYVLARMIARRLISQQFLAANDVSSLEEPKHKLNERVNDANGNVLRMKQRRSLESDSH